MQHVLLATLQYTEVMLEEPLAIPLPEALADLQLLYEQHALVLTHEIL